MFGTHPLHSSNQSELVPSDKECMSAALNLATNDFASEHRYPFGASSALISLCSHLLQPDSNDRPDDSSLMQVYDCITLRSQLWIRFWKNELIALLSPCSTPSSRRCQRSRESCISARHLLCGRRARDKVLQKVHS